jgi:hypothetical protein
LSSAAILARGVAAEEVAVMAKGRPIDVRFYGPTLAQIEELERMSGKSISEILRESVNLSNWLCKELRSGAKLLVRRPGAGGAPVEVVFK